jgi:branched-chain amino acid transport system substrate-binding protein
MKKFLLFMGGVIVVSGIVSGVLWWAGIWPQGQRSNPIIIAVVGPTRGADVVSGDAMRKGIQLYLQTHNVRKMLHGRPLELRFFNDQGSTQQAAKVADEVVNAEALLVLGHYFSDSSLAAGDTYQKRGLPAITASATADTITKNNDWYFQTISNNDFQGRFIASYVKNILEHTTTTILYDTDHYGTSLKQSYEEKARELGMEIQTRKTSKDGTWQIDRESSNFAQEIKNLVAELQKMDDPGAIFLALHDTEAVKIITALKLPGVEYTFIGADGLATPQLLEELQQTPQERSEPGYYSDGIYVVTPFIEDLATDAGLAFIRQFEQKYHASPSWESAFYYDAAMIAMTAIERAELDGLDLTTDRRKVRDALAQLSEPDRAMTGVTGTLYFDAKRNINRPLNVCIYERQRLLPAYVQYQAFDTQVPGALVSSPDLLKLKNILTLGDLVMSPTQIIKAGLNVNKISYLNLFTGQYTLDGYLWFRFQDDLKAGTLKFRNAVAPVKISKPVVEEKEGKITTQIYYLNGSFTPQIINKDYPWDRLILPVQFRHLSHPVTRVRYVVDTTHLVQDPKHVSQQINPIAGWVVEDLQTMVTTIKEKNISYSQFNVIVQLSRMNIGWMVKNLFPLSVLMLLLYWVYYLPIERPGPRLLLLGCGTVATILYEVLLRWKLRPTGVLMIEYGVFAIYGLIGLALLVSLGGYACHTRSKYRLVKLLSFTGRVLHPILAVLVVAAGVIFTMLLPSQIAEFVSRML